MRVTQPGGLTTRPLQPNGVNHVPTSPVNPFYRTAPSGISSFRQPTLCVLVYVKLPAAPRTGSPVPHLTSPYHFSRAGEYGSRDYPGNCGGNHIKDLLRFFQPSTVLDPMTGSGTCRDACRELAIPCFSTDLKSGFDASDPKAYAKFSETRSFDFVWAHPPYWRQKIDSDNPRDMSRSLTLATFLESYAVFIRECARLLSPRGKFAILMGDYSVHEAGFVSLTFHRKRLAFAAGLQQSCTDIVRFSHGASSSQKTYRSSFIPELHDVCMVFERPCWQ
jgi:hypothetical protein